MDDVKKKLNEELFKCKVKISWNEAKIIEESFDLLYNNSKEEKKESIRNLKNKILNNTKIKVC